jgi:UDP-glucose 4-epimerase
MKHTILVTGGAGYIGSKVATDLIKNNHRVVIIDNLSTGYKSLIPKKAFFFKCNISNLRLVKKILIEFNIKTVFHFAASLNILESHKNPKKYFNNNYINTKKIIDVCVSNNIKNFIFSSTCAVYDGNVGKVNENTKLNPKSNYGKSKLKAENYLKKNKMINYAILRYFNVAGADIKNKIGCINQTDQLIKNLSRNINKKKYRINIFGNNYKTYDGTCVRDYIYLNDISKIHIETMKYLNLKNKNLILNCGYGVGYSVLDVVNKFQKYIKKVIKINYKDDRKGDLPIVISDTSKIRKLFKIKLAKNPMNKIISSALKWEKIII